jgi:orotate phosphoribosyltransferase
MSWVDVTGAAPSPGNHESNGEFDLDKLWSRPEHLKRAREILVTAARELNQPYDAVAAITSNVGAFGTTPLATALALEKNKELIIFVETEFGRYYVAPLSQDDQAFFTSKKIVLIKDIVVGGRSLIHVGSLVAQHGGFISGIITLVDMGASQPLDIAATTDETVMFSILSRTDLRDLGRQP